jgi:hypothetical protein
VGAVVSGQPSVTELKEHDPVELIRAAARVVRDFGHVFFKSALDKQHQINTLMNFAAKLDAAIEEEMK